MMRRLQDNGFVERIPSEQDQRVNLVRLTSRGIEFTLEVLPISQKISDDVLAPLKPRDRERFIEMLKQLG
jgi:DNA-binding MarR family transcriptional regulator